MPRRLHELDQRAFAATARVESPVLDATLPRLTHAANHSRLWLGAALLLWLSGRRHSRRAALRGLLSIAATSAATNVPAKMLTRRARPPQELVPLHRHARRKPTSSSFPSGHAASAFAFATGVAREEPALAVPAYGLAAAVAYSRVYTGVHYPGDVVVGAAIGTGVGLASTRLWPVAPHEPASARVTFTRSTAEPSPDGAGVVVVVNPDAGPALSSNPADQLRAALPGAKVVEAEGEEIVAALRAGTKEARALGVAGGDGSVNCAAQIALDAGLPLLVVPGGTLNHFARDIGLGSVDDAVDAVREGSLVGVDVGTIDGEPFLNTASFGAYADLVDLRERLEKRLGKWPALVVAMARVLSRSEPVEVELDGTRRRIWMIFVGNCRYHPAGFLPSWRERLDDGLLDVRIVDADHRFARARVLLAAVLGRLGRTAVHEQRLVEKLHVRCVGGPVRLARDGETFDGHAEFDLAKREHPLAVYLPDRG